MSDPTRITHEQLIEAPQTKLVLDKVLIGKLTKGDTTPDVKNVENWKAQNIAPLLVTNFTNGQPGQHLYIEGDGLTSLQHGTKILLGGANLLLLPNIVYHLLYRDGKWLQVLDSTSAAPPPPGGGASNPAGAMIDMVGHELDAESPYIIPGKDGVIGRDGLSIQGPPGWDAEPADEPLMVPGLQGATGLRPGLRYLWDNTNVGDPLSKYIKVNNSPITLVTEVWVSETDADAIHNDFIATFGDSTSPIKGYIYINHATLSYKYAVFAITAVIDEGWIRIRCKISAASPFSFVTDDNVFLNFSRTGDVGLIGSPGMDAAEPDEPLMIPGRPGDTGAPGVAGVSTQGPPGLDAEEAEYPYIIPGPPGPSSPGTPGATGASVQGAPGLDAEEPLEPLMVPGRQGDKGNTGATGIGLPGQDAEEPEYPYIIPGSPGASVIGPAGISIQGPPGTDADPPDEPLMIQGLRGVDGAAGGGGSATTIEVNLGTTAKWTGRFTITDAAITAAKKVLCWQAPGPYTGKGTRADEAEVQPVNVIAVSPAAGSAIVYWQTPPYVTGYNQLLRGTGAASGDLSYAQANRRLGKVRGNVKFTYQVLT